MWKFWKRKSDEPKSPEVRSGFPKSEPDANPEQQVEEQDSGPQLRNLLKFLQSLFETELDAQLDFCLLYTSDAADE